MEELVEKEALESRKEAENLLEVKEELEKEVKGRKMTFEAMKCRVPNCSFGANGEAYQTPEACNTYASKNADIRNHIGTDHKGNDFDRKTKDKVELKIERPHIKANVTELDWKIFEAKLDGLRRQQICQKWLGFINSGPQWTRKSNMH